MRVEEWSFQKYANVFLETIPRPSFTLIEVCSVCGATRSSLVRSNAGMRRVYQVGHFRNTLTYFSRPFLDPHLPSLRCVQFVEQRGQVLSSELPCKGLGCGLGL